MRTPTWTAGQQNGYAGGGNDEQGQLDLAPYRTPRQGQMQVSVRFLGNLHPETAFLDIL